MTTEHPFLRLTPEAILTSVEQFGLPTDGRLVALNSYENRVFRIGLRDGDAVVGKFYRPGRWTDDQILEEHRWTQALADEEIPVVPPLRYDGRSLLTYNGFHYALYPYRPGHAPEFDNPDHLTMLGRFVGRIHNLGAVQTFAHRPTFNIQAFGDNARRCLIDGGWLPHDLRAAYNSVSADALDAIRAGFARAGSVNSLRLHGDLHLGNILWRNDQPGIVDFDDARMGPAVQDLWMFLSGDSSERTGQLLDLLDGYQTFRDFDPRELHLIEPLRTLRIMHHAAWIAGRWADPAFPHAFPYFAEQHFWETHILSLREQLAAMQEPPLSTVNTLATPRRARY